MFILIENKKKQAKSFGKYVSCEYFVVNRSDDPWISVILFDLYNKCNSHIQLVYILKLSVFDCVVSAFFYDSNISWQQKIRFRTSSIYRQTRTLHIYNAW